MKKKKFHGNCPLCEKSYSKKVHKTHHHVFCKCWYGDGITVEVCSDCHMEFNKKYPIVVEHTWSKSECLTKWNKFCSTKNKISIVVYPQLKKAL